MSGLEEYPHQIIVSGAAGGVDGRGAPVRASFSTLAEIVLVTEELMVAKPSEAFSLVVSEALSTVNYSLGESSAEVTAWPAL